MHLLEHKEVLRLNEPIVGKVKTPFFRRNLLKVLCVIFTITIIVLGALLYNTSRLYSYEQNMRRYAMYQEYGLIQSGFRALAMHIRYNTTSLLPSVIPEIAASLIRSGRVMAYLDAEHNDVWLNIEHAGSTIRFLNYMYYFPNGTEFFPPGQVYENILVLDASITEAFVEAHFTTGEYLYKPGTNVLEWNEDMLINASQTSKNLVQLTFDHYGPFPL